MSDSSRENSCQIVGSHPRTFSVPSSGDETDESENEEIIVSRSNSSRDAGEKCKTPASKPLNLCTSDEDSAIQAQVPLTRKDSRGESRMDPINIDINSHADNAVIGDTEDEGLDHPTPLRKRAVEDVVFDSEDEGPEVIVMRPQPNANGHDDERSQSVLGAHTSDPPVTARGISNDGLETQQRAWPELSEIQGGVELQQCQTSAEHGTPEHTQDQTPRRRSESVSSYMSELAENWDSDEEQSLVSEEDQEMPPADKSRPANEYQYSITGNKDRSDDSNVSNKPTSALAPACEEYNLDYGAGKGHYPSFVACNHEVAPVIQPPGSPLALAHDGFDETAFTSGSNTLPGALPGSSSTTGASGSPRWTSTYNGMIDISKSASPRFSPEIPAYRLVRPFGYAPVYTRAPSPSDAALAKKATSPEGYYPSFPAPRSYNAEPERSESTDYAAGYFHEPTAWGPPQASATFYRRCPGNILDHQEVGRKSSSPTHNVQNDKNYRFRSENSFDFQDPEPSTYEQGPFSFAPEMKTTSTARKLSFHSPAQKSCLVKLKVDSGTAEGQDPAHDVTTAARKSNKVTISNLVNSNGEVSRGLKRKSDEVTCDEVVHRFCDAGSQVASIKDVSQEDGLPDAQPRDEPAIVDELLSQASETPSSKSSTPRNDKIVPEGPSRKKVKTSPSRAKSVGKFVSGVCLGLAGAFTALIATTPTSVWEEALREAAKIS